MRTDDGFCPECEVSLDLHPDPKAEDQDPDDCAVAGQKADLMVAIIRPFV